MPVAGGGFEQCYNAQAAVAAGSLLVVAADVVQAPNDKQQLEPMLDKLARLARGVGRRRDAAGRQRLFQRGQCGGLRGGGHRTADRARVASPIIRRWRERFAAAPPAPDNPTPVEAMAHRLTTPEGKKLYALRKQTPEPVFGIIKSVLGFRQFSLRGLDKVRGEWSLVTMAWNIKRMFALKPAATPRIAPARAIRALPILVSGQGNRINSRSNCLSGLFYRTFALELRPLTFSPTGC